MRSGFDLISIQFDLIRIFSTVITDPRLQFLHIA